MYDSKKSTRFIFGMLKQSEKLYYFWKKCCHFLFITLWQHRPSQYMKIQNNLNNLDYKEGKWYFCNSIKFCLLMLKSKYCFDFWNYFFKINLFWWTKLYVSPIWPGLFFKHWALEGRGDEIDKTEMLGFYYENAWV